MRTDVGDVSRVVDVVSVDESMLGYCCGNYKTPSQPFSACHTVSVLYEPVNVSS